MPRGHPRITRAYVKRALRGAAQAGIGISEVRVEIAGDGKIIIVPNSAISAYDDQGGDE